MKRNLSRNKPSALALIAGCLALCGGTAHADYLSVHSGYPATTGHYVYPMDRNRNPIPGYLYVPTETDVQFLLTAQGGVTVHVFTDTTGNTEVTMPPALSNLNNPDLNPSASLRVDSVHMTAGWHRLTLEQNVTSVDSVRPTEICNLDIRGAILHDRIETVLADFLTWTDNWQPDINNVPTMSGEVWIKQADANTSAQGDNLTWRISKITTDAAGQNVVSMPGVTVDGDATPDADGHATFKVHFDSAQPCLNQVAAYYLFLELKDISQPAAFFPVIATPNSTTPAASRTGTAARTSSPGNYAVTGGPITYTCPGGGGGSQGPAPFPQRVVKVPAPTPSGYSETHVEYYGTPSNNIATWGHIVWGHQDTYDLKVLDNFGNIWTQGDVREQFLNPHHNPAVPEFANAPGTQSTWWNGSLFVNGYFTDHNGAFLLHDTGRETPWYDFTQKWWIDHWKPQPVPLINTHTVRHIQRTTTRTVN